MADEILSASIQAAGSVLGALVAAKIAVSGAIKGLENWRSETSGKRSLELTEKALLSLRTFKQSIASLQRSYPRHKAKFSLTQLEVVENFNKWRTEVRQLIKQSENEFSLLKRDLDLVMVYKSLQISSQMNDIDFEYFKLCNKHERAMMELENRWGDTEHLDAYLAERYMHAHPNFDDDEFWKTEVYGKFREINDALTKPISEVENILLRQLRLPE